MKKVKFFTEESIDKLQLIVNEWLAENKAIGIIRTDMQSATPGEKIVHSFYILYEALETTAMAAVAVQMENIIPEQGISAGEGDVQLQ